VIQETFSDIKDLEEHLLALELPRGSRITIDGLDGSGKTYLAQALADKLRYRHLEIDRFLNKKQGGFLDQIRYSELGDALQQADAGSSTVVEGCCIQEVMKRVGRVPELKIYVKEVDVKQMDGERTERWTNGDFLTKYDNPQDAIAGEEEGLSEFQTLILEEQGQADTLPCLQKELIQYHFQYLPHKTADLIFARSA